MNEKQAKRHRMAVRRPRATTYFDTSSLRNAGERLPHANNDGKARTSVLAICELISGLLKSDSEFCRRRATLRRIDDSKLTVDWRITDLIALDSFEMTRKQGVAIWNSSTYLDYKSRIEQIKRIAVGASSSDDFLRELVSSCVQDTFKQIESEHAEYARQYRHEFSLLYPSLKESVWEHFHMRPDEFVAKLDRDDKTKIFENSVRLLATRSSDFIRKHYGSEDSQFGTDEIYKTYNASSNVWVMAFGFRHRKDFKDTTMNGKLINVNDGWDLEHFMYISKDMTLVSEDKDQLRLAKEIGLTAVPFDKYAPPVAVRL